MKKLIEIPDEIKTDLKVLAAKADKNLTEYIKDLLVKHVRDSKQ